MTFKLTQKQAEFVRLAKTYRHVIAEGGAGSGKTLLILRLWVIRALRLKSRHAVCRRYQTDVRATIWTDNFPKVFSIAFPELTEGVHYTRNNSSMEVKFPNGSVIKCLGLDEDMLDKVLGGEYSGIFYNEVSQIDYTSVVFGHTRIREASGLRPLEIYDQNPGSRLTWPYRLFHQNLDPAGDGVKKISNPDIYGKLTMNPVDNQENLSAEYIATLDNLPERQRKRFYLGAYQIDIPGALWTQHMVDLAVCPGAELPDFSRIIVAVDPAITAKSTSDETGIIVIAREQTDSDTPKFWVLDDASGVYTPIQWALKCIELYHRYMASAIVGETNQGGDLVESNIRRIDPDVKFVPVHASKGKYKRFEPVSALYEKGRVHHHKRMPVLEEQMLNYTPDTTESPDRLDAMCWGLTELSGVQRRAGII